MGVFNTSGNFKPDFKTSGITPTEWRSMFSKEEVVRVDKARAKIEADLSWLSFGASIDTDAAADGYPGFTYRDLLRSVFQGYNDATTFDVECKELIVGVKILDKVGLLDDASRKNKLLRGLPQ